MDFKVSGKGLDYVFFRVINGSRLAGRIHNKDNVGRVLGFGILWKDDYMLMFAINSLNIIKNVMKENKIIKINFKSKQCMWLKIQKFDAIL